MQQFRADLHIHSRFSRATSKSLGVRQLAAWAAIKGLDVLGTGDFTHPKWREELQSLLVRDEVTGLYALSTDARKDLYTEVPSILDDPQASLFSAPGHVVTSAGLLSLGKTLFIPQAEISSIYKRGGKVRKVHNLVFMPDFEAVDRLCTKLEVVGNLASDGRPILGLDSHDLLEMVLDCDSRGVVIPAHIWTPWFAMFGSKSGFDSVEECFGDLASEIFAVETGLSSDPEMNWHLSALDGLAQISNSDAHSGENLGREANLFSGAISYDGMFQALKRQSEACRFEGTLEFFPEEGKYHLDGHRQCGVVMEPHETKACGNVCPVCGKPLTVGVLHRVLALADREKAVKPEGSPDFTSLIPLPTIIGEIVGVGPKTRKVQQWQSKLVAHFGAELSILQDIPVEDLRQYWEPLGEAIARMRRGDVIRQGGYDGEYGVVQVFNDAEHASLRSRGKTNASLLSLLDDNDTISMMAKPKRRPKNQGNKPPVETKPQTITQPIDKSATIFPPHVHMPTMVTHHDHNECKASHQQENEMKICIYNEGQSRALCAGPEPVLVLAGPGTGKTRTLIGRITHLLEQGVSAHHILAVTFTRRAAKEMEDRLIAALPVNALVPCVDTLHALAFATWQGISKQAPVLLSEEAARRVFAEANPDENAQTLRKAWDSMSLSRERLEPCAPSIQPFFERYTHQKNAWNLADYTDLLEFWLDQIQSAAFGSPDVHVLPWAHVLVDEIQDLSPLQLALVKVLVPADGKGFFGIGDTDQSIYGFRGAQGQVQSYLHDAWPTLQTITLQENYRSASAILDAAATVLPHEQIHEVQELSLIEEDPHSGEAIAPQTRPRLVAVHDRVAEIHHFVAPSAESEAQWIAERIHKLIGATSHSILDQHAEGVLDEGNFSPSDIAILVRIKALIPVIEKTLSRFGIPCAAPEVEAFWTDERVAHILQAAGRFVGIGGSSDISVLHCPDKVLARGPLGVSAYLRDAGSFDMLFWQSKAFRQLVKAFDVHGGWAPLINWIGLQGDLDAVRRKSEKVQIMTMHAAKGLEFRAVFLPAFEDGLVPFKGPSMLSGQLDKDTHYDEEEERRLLYVAMTRAAEGLYTSQAQKRMLYGRELRLPRSRFAGGILEHATRSALICHNKSTVQQLRLLD